MPKKNSTAQSNRKSSRKRSEGYYKRRRGVVEHIESGTVDLLEAGIHDYLNLKANLVIGNGYAIPAGVCFTSAPALHAHCKRRVSERTVQRILEHLEEINWIKTWAVPGKRGNYAVLICRASVHDLSGNEYRVNGEATTDWRHPVYDPVGELSGSCQRTVGELAGNREVREEKREEAEEVAAASTPSREEKKERLEAWDAIGEKPFGPRWFISGWENTYADRPAGELLKDTMEDFIQHCQDRGGPMPPKPFFDAKHRIENQESEDDSEVRRVAGPRGVSPEFMR